ncbi:hypothetical protein C8J56DRAFT_927940 [Mycena floridula]|nr:hypothetical protein C8J56DRAFT_927940 [Mycena floridula]
MITAISTTEMNQEKPSTPDPNNDHRKALKDLVQSWMDRLQLISLITTFFAGVEAGMLQITVIDTSSGWARAANATFLGALVMHVNAAGVSFVAAFALIHYKIQAAKNEEHQSAQGGSQLSRARPAVPPPASYLWSASSPHLVQVGPWRESEPPVHLLSRCHTLSMLLSAVGFALAVTGIFCFTWAQQPLSVSIFTTSCLGLSFIIGTYLLTSSRHDDHMLYARHL